MTAIHSMVVGRGDIPLVFIPGLFGQGKNWLSIAKRLGEEATCLLVDPPNHGRSAWTQSFDYDAFADAIYTEIVRHEAFRDGFVLVGHSMGGKLAMRMALRHPESVRLLVVVDISPIAGHVGSQFGSLVAALRGLDLAALGSRKQADELLAPDIPDPVTRGFLLQNLHHDRGAEPEWSWRMNLRLLGDSLDLVGAWTPTEATYPGPVLWLAGARSTYVRPEHLPLMRGLFPRAVLVTIKDAGHWVHSEQPKAFVASLRAFLALNYLG
ncbi:MAG: alpha/beta fold hydrolase [Propionibacteriaceae bacterium]|nr:alpha/beta fold hydrolase [Propionibacteriaceae bacterium]